MAFAYILPSGKYYDATDFVADGSVKVDPRPSEDHKLADNWEELHRVGANIWRPKTPEELQVETDAEFVSELNGHPILKALIEELEVSNPGLLGRIKGRR